jgi:hypothetical protein
MRHRMLTLSAAEETSFNDAPNCELRCRLSGYLLTTTLDSGPPT